MPFDVGDTIIFLRPRYSIINEVLLARRCFIGLLRDIQPHRYYPFFWKSLCVSISSTLQSNKYLLNTKQSAFTKPLNLISHMNRKFIINYGISPSHTLSLFLFQSHSLNLSLPLSHSLSCKADSTRYTFQSSAFTCYCHGQTFCLFISRWNEIYHSSDRKR